MSTRKKSMLPVLTSLLAMILIVTASISCKPEPEEKGKKVKAKEQKSEKSKEGGEATNQSEKSKKRMVNLYFTDKNSEYLFPERRQVFDSTNTTENVLEELIKGPKTEGYMATIPNNTKIKGVSLSDDVIVIDFSRELVDDHPGGSAFELMTVYSIVNTVTEVAGVKKVKFLIEGQEIETLAGNFDLTQLVERDESKIKK